MKQRFTLYISKQKDEPCRVEGSSYELIEEDGSIKGQKVLKTDEPDSGKIRLPKTNGVRLLALVMIRVAQFKYLPLADQIEGEVPILTDGWNSDVVHQFFNLRRDVPKPAPHGISWLQEMFKLEGDSFEDQRGGRFRTWFTVSEGQNPVVRCNLKMLRPESVVVKFNSVEASLSELDMLESNLSSILQAGIPNIHLAALGIKLGGKWPSIHPSDWEWREEEGQELDAIYQKGQTSFVCIVGNAATGKTVFAKNWLRTLIGLHAVRHKFVFGWTFSREGASSTIHMPTLELFWSLANFLEISFAENLGPIAKANVILQALAKKPTLIYFDGIEASAFLPEESTSDKKSKEIVRGLEHLLLGITSLKDSFAMMTSRVDLISKLTLAQSTAVSMKLKPKPKLQMMKLFKALGFESLPAPDRIVSTDSWLKVLKMTTGSDTEAEVIKWVEDNREIIDAIRKRSPAIPPTKLSDVEEFSARLIIERLDSAPSGLLLYIIACCHKAILTDDLFSVATLTAPNASLEPLMIRRHDQDWGQDLDVLIKCGILEQMGTAIRYSLHPDKRRYISESLKARNTALWVEIKRQLAECYLKKAPNNPPKKEDLPALVEAAIFLCEAGDRQRAFDEICFERMSQRLKGYSVTFLGDYESPKSIIDAFYGDSNGPQIGTVSLEKQAFIKHAEAGCSRFQDHLEVAWEQQWESWRLAKRAGSIMMQLPIATVLLRLSHIFGRLSDTNEIFKTLAFLVLKDKMVSMEKDFEDEDIVDGASALSSFVALTALYRGAPNFIVKGTLQSGVKKCHLKGGQFQLLMPTFGKPWHTLSLLELGNLEECEAAKDRGEFASEMVRYQQVGAFEWLSAKLFLELAKKRSGVDRSKAIAKAETEVGKAIELATMGGYRWWECVSTLTLGQILTLSGRHKEAEGYINTALNSSKESRFDIVTVDAQTTLAQLAHTTGRINECRAVASEGLLFSKKIGYSLRRTLLRRLAQVS